MTLGQHVPHAEMRRGGEGVGSASSVRSTPGACAHGQCLEESGHKLFYLRTNLCKTKRNSAEFEECDIRICGIENFFKKRIMFSSKNEYMHI